MGKRRARPLDAVVDEVAPGLTETGGVQIFKTESGRAFFKPAHRPRAWDRLSREGQEYLAGLQQIVSQIHELQGHLEVHVQDARECGASWDIIGWSIGTTGEAARQRFGTRTDEDEW